MRLPAEIRPDQITAVIDTREHVPLDLSPLRSVSGTLATGDYSVRGLEHVIAIERNSLGDLTSCMGSERERFEREVQRLLAYSTRSLVVEACWSTIELGQYRNKIKPAAAMGSLLGWIATGLPLIMARYHQSASKMVSKILFITARRRWRETRMLANGIASGGPADAI